MFHASDRKFVFITVTSIIVLKYRFSSSWQGEKGLLGHPGKRGKRGLPGSQGDQGAAGDTGLKGQIVCNHSGWCKTSSSKS